MTSAALLASGVGVTIASAPSAVAEAPQTVSEAPRVVPDVSPAEVPVALVSDTREASPEPGEAIGGGTASYYGRAFAGNPTASGETFDPSDLTAAHRTLPFGTRLRVTHERTGESVVVRVNDRGPFHDDRVIDLSRAAADAVGLTEHGTGEVSLERIGARG